MLELVAHKRDTARSTEELRKEGNVPAVFYGRKEKSTPITVLLSDFKKALKQAGESTVLTLKTPEKNMSVLIHDISYEPIHDEPIHVDFYVVEADKAVEVEVPLSFTGVAPAEKNLGGVLVKVLHELSVSGLPKDLPHEIVVDLSALEKMDDSISAKDIILPTGITLVQNGDDVVALMTNVEEENKEETEFNPDAVEVEAKGKTEEEGESKEE